MTSSSTKKAKEWLAIGPVPARPMSINVSLKMCLAGAALLQPFVPEAELAGLAEAIYVAMETARRDVG